LRASGGAPPALERSLGDFDGNPATAGDASWTSYIATLPFPDCVSGHSTFSGAAARVLGLFYGSDQIAFTTPLISFPV
jgi:hypothetical protein